MLILATNNYQAQEGHTIFNSAIAKLIRIDRIKCVMHEARFVNNNALWFKCLLSIREEVNEVLDKNERIECERLIKNCTKVNPNPSKKNPSPVIYDDNSLMEFGMYLSDLEHKYGMGIPKQKGSSFLDT